MSDLFGWHHSSESPVSKQLLSGLKSRLVLDPIRGANFPRVGGGRRAFGIKLTMQQQALDDILGEGLDPRTTLRLALEKVAQGLEARQGNALYMAAWKSAAKFIRSYKPD
jgi:hypothetical protein